MVEVELGDIFLELEKIESALTDVCYFEHRVSKDSYEQNLYKSELHPTYLVFDKRFLPFFQNVLSKFDAKELKSSPTFNDYEIIYGSEEAILRVI